jgi:PBSX family phage terminase large subunit
LEARLIILPEYKPLYLNDTRYFFLSSGRGAGKSFAVADFLLKLTYDGQHTILYLRYTMVSASISILPEFIHKIESYGLEHIFEVTQNEIINKQTGSNILFKGIKTSSGNQTAALKSIANVSTVVFEELEDLHDENVFDTIDLSVRHKNLQNRIICILNPSYKSHWSYQRFFKIPKINHDFTGEKDGTTYIFSSYLNNINNLPESFIQTAEKAKRNNIVRYNHLFLGEWLEDSEGILWNRNIIERQRIDEKPELVRVVVAIDPAGTKTMESDETGIVVVGKSANGHIYVLDDVSGKYSPLEWATLSKKMVEKWNADCVVAEKNMGHDLVESVLKQIDKKTRIKLVNATKGKMTRAEPIYSLYEQGLIWHVGMFPQLERQMITFNPEVNKDSPDRVDALVWGATELCEINIEFFAI